MFANTRVIEFKPHYPIIGFRRFFGVTTGGRTYDALPSDPLEIDQTPSRIASEAIKRSGTRATLKEKVPVHCTRRWVVQEYSEPDLCGLLSNPQIGMISRQYRL